MDRLPNGRYIVLSDFHGICSTKYIEGKRTTVQFLDFLYYTIELSSRTAEGQITGSFGETSADDLESVVQEKIAEPGGQWTLTVGRRQGKTVMARSVGGTTATITIEKDVRGTEAAVRELLGSMEPCNVVIGPPRQEPSDERR